MTTLTTHAGVVLLVAFGMSLLYELWRATARAGTSRHDSMAAFLRQLVTYVIAGVVIVALFAGWDWGTWGGLAVSVIGILVSVFHYNPVIMLARQPGIVDWVEDLVFTGLLFVAATLLLYEALGKSLQG